MGLTSNLHSPKNTLLNWLAKVYTKNLVVIRKVFDKSSIEGQSFYWSIA